MANPNRRAGIIYVKIDGEVYDAKGSFTYNLGRPKREGMAGSDGVHGYKEKPQVPFIEGEITDKQTLDLDKLLSITNSTATLELANGKTIVLKESWYAADGDVQTEESNIQLRLEGMEADEI